MNSPLERLLGLLPKARKSGDGWSAPCPAHNDRRASLSIGQSDDGTALVKCHAGCDTSAVLAAVGLKLVDLFPPKPERKPSRNGKPKGSSKPKRSEQTFPTANDAVAELERRHGKRSAMWTYHDIDGNPVGLVVRWNLADGKKDIRPVALFGDGWRIAAMPEPRPLYGLSHLTNADRVIVTEGEKAADAARTLGFVATTSAGGSQAGAKSDWRPLAGKIVWILPDNDPPGRKYADTVVRILAKLTPAPVVKVVELPNLPEKGDIVDWIEAHGDAAEPDGMRSEIEALANAVEPWHPEINAKPTDRSLIQIGTDEFRVNDEAIEALAHESDLYQRGGCLVHVLDKRPHDEGDDEEPKIRRPLGAPVVRELARPLLRERLSRCAQWIRPKVTPQGDEILTPAHPPDWCVGAVHARGEWPGVRPLNAVLPFPALTPNGSLIASNGYHRKTGVLVHMPTDLKLMMPDRPTANDAKGAVATLLEPLVDFPFETEAHRASLLAGWLTPLAWFLFDGPAPLFLIDKNVRGAGAGLLADVVALTLTGRRFPVMTYSHNREELQKCITTLALEGDRLVLLDNLSGPVGNDVLDAALTADWWKNRLLGGNKIYDGPLHVVWFGTGNNIQLHADTSRRVCHVRMESTEERPELRTGFKYPRLRDHVLKNRSLYLSAALTLLRAWIVASKPKHGLPAWGSFEGWSDVVREALVFAGLSDPGETRIALQTAADRDATAMADILAGMVHLDPGRRGLTTAEIAKTLKDDNGSNEIIGAMRVAVEELCGKIDARPLAMKFRSFKRRNFNGNYLDVGGSSHGSNRWVVSANGQARAKDPHHRPHPHPSGGDGGDGGDALAGVGDEEEAF